MTLIPVILAGGVGERFWPLSRAKTPKQLLPLVSETPLVVETLERVASFCTKGVKPLIVSSQSIVLPLKKMLAHIPHDSIAEPCGKNTAPAVLLAALYLQKKYGDNAVMAVLSADHAIKPTKAFVKDLSDAGKLALQKSCMVVFGITPARPDTGYGYIRKGTRITDAAANNAAIVRQFVEKPDAATAKKYLSTGEYLWNSGMFVWTIGTILEEFSIYQPEMFKLATKAAKASFTPAAIKAYYTKVASISVDYAIMEHTKRAAVITAGFTWDDVGSWDAVSRHRPLTKAKTVAVGSNVLDHDCTNSIIVNNTKLTIAAIGLDSIVLVATPDAILAIHRDKLPDIKKSLAALKADKRFPATLF